MSVRVHPLNCPENPDKSTRTDSRARMETGHCPSGFPSGFALSVSGFRPTALFALAANAPALFTTWEQGFCAGCRRRMAAGPLSSRQLAVLVRIANRVIAQDAAALNLAPARAFAQESA